MVELAVGWVGWQLSFDLQHISVTGAAGTLPSTADLHWRRVVRDLTPLEELCRPWAAIAGA